MGQDGHSLKNAIGFSCGHFICKNCVPDQAFITCKICSVKTNKSEFKVDIESDSIKNIIKTNLSGLFVDLEKRTIDEINKFKSKNRFCLNFNKINK